MKHRSIREIQDTILKGIREGKIKGQLAADLEYLALTARLAVECFGEPESWQNKVQQRGAAS